MPKKKYRKKRKIVPKHEEEEEKIEKRSTMAEKIEAAKGLNVKY